MTRLHRLLGASLLAGFLLPSPALADRMDDLQSELLQLREEMEQLKSDDPLGNVRINGYYAFDIITDSGSGRNSFRQHSFNLFVGKEWANWQVLSEIEFEDGASIHHDGAGSVEATGGIALEYGWFQYRLSDALQVRGGKFLIPEYWNEHHFAPVTMSVANPLMHKKIFPESGVGLMLRGSTYASKVGVSYQGWVTNGDSHEAIDTDDHKGVGGKLAIHLGGLFSATGRLDIAFHGFHTLRDYPPGSGTPPLEAVDISGLEMQISSRRFELLAEYCHQDGLRGPEGFYVQPALRLTRKLRAFYRFGGLDEGLANPDPNAGFRTRHTGGFNWRPQPNITVKLEGNNTRFDDAARTRVQQMLASVALFF